MATVEELQTRVDELERRIADMQLALKAAAAELDSAAGHLKQGVESMAREIVTGRLVIAGPDGYPVAVLEPNEHGTGARLLLVNPQARCIVAAVQADAKGAGQVVVNTAEGKPVAVLDVDGDGGLVLFSEDGRTARMYRPA